MTRAVFKQADMTRAVKAMKAAGEVVDRVKVAPDGTLTVYSANEEADEGDRALAEWVKNNDARKT